MTDQNLTGREVLQQSESSAPLDTEPAVLVGTIMGVLGAILALLVMSGTIGQGDADVISRQAAVIVPALIVVVGIVSGAITRSRVYSPKSAAKIAIVNASSPVGAPPTLAPPP